MARPPAPPPSPAADVALARLRLANQRVTSAGARSPAELVRSLGAVQAQDYPGALWAVGLRLQSAVESAVEAAIAQRAIVRTWPMRGTLHFVPAEDVRWMLRLLAPRPLARAAARHRQLGLADADFARARRILGRGLRGGRRLARPEAYAALDRGGVAPGGQRGIHVLAQLAQTGFLCFGPRQGRQPTFVLLEEWAPAAPEPSRDEALAILAERFFTSHGPATLQDFAWWSGLLARDARRGVEAAGARLREQLREKKVVYSASRSRRGASGAPRAVLLPPWDESVVAYRDGPVGVGLPGAASVHRLKLLGSPLVVIDGRVRGTWRRAVAASVVRVTLELWTPLGARERRAVEEAAARFGAFLGREVELLGLPS